MKIDTKVTEFGRFLRRIRQSRSLTQQALADKCGVTRAAIAHLETGFRKDPRMRTVRALEAALDSEISYRGWLSCKQSK